MLYTILIVVGILFMAIWVRWTGPTLRVERAKHPGAAGEDL
jgi:hypothetical protein